MRISKKLKILAIMGLATASLNSCSNTQMAVTRLALAGTLAAVGAYEWISNPDAETAFGLNANTVFKDVESVIKSNSDYQITSTTTGQKQSQIVAQSNGETVKVVVENIGNNQSEVYIKDGRGKDQATILLNQIIKKLN